MVAADSDFNGTCIRTNEETLNRLFSAEETLKVY